MPPDGLVFGLPPRRSLPPPPPSSSSSGSCEVFASERRNRANRTPPRISAARCRDAKMTISPSSGATLARLPPEPREQTSFRYHGTPLAAPVSTRPRAPITTTMAADTNKLSLTARDPEGSRSARRLRREGLVPGVIYGHGDAPQHFAVDGRILRNTLAHSGAILQISLDGGGDTPVLVKDIQRHPVRGEAVHVDLLRVNMDEKIHTTAVVDLIHADEAPGVVEGGVLSQETREINIEALPGDIPETIEYDASGMQINDTLTLAQLTP